MGRYQLFLKSIRYECDIYRYLAFFDTNIDIVTSQSKTFLWCCHWQAKRLQLMDRMSKIYVIAKVVPGTYSAVTFFKHTATTHTQTGKYRLSAQTQASVFKWMVTWRVSKGIETSDISPKYRYFSTRPGIDYVEYLVSVHRLKIYNM